MANPLEQVLNRVKQILTPASNAMSVARMQAQNLGPSAVQRQNAMSIGRATLDAPKAFAQTFYNNTAPLGSALGYGLREAVYKPFGIADSQLYARQNQTNINASRLAKTPQAKQRLLNEVPQMMRVDAQKAQDLRNAAPGSAAKTALTLIGAGAPGQMLAGAGVGGTLNAGLTALQGGNVAEAFGEGAAQALPYAGVNRLTSPFWNAVTNDIVGNSTSALGRRLVSGTVMAGGNVAENSITTPLLEGRMPTLSENLIAGGAGFGFGAAIPVKANTPVKTMRQQLEIIASDQPRVKGQYAQNDELRRAAKIVLGNKPIPKDATPKFAKLINQIKFELKNSELSDLVPDPKGGGMIRTKLPGFIDPSAKVGGEAGKTFTDWNGKPLGVGDSASYATKWGNAEGKIVGFKETKLGTQAEVELPDHVWNRMKELPAYKGKNKPKTTLIEIGNLNETGTQSTPLEALQTEARKYKSAEEFIQSQKDMLAKLLADKDYLNKQLRTQNYVGKADKTKIIREIRNIDTGIKATQNNLVYIAENPTKVMVNTPKTDISAWKSKVTSNVTPQTDLYNQATAPKVEAPNLTQQVAENVTGKRLRVKPSPTVEAPPIKPLTEPDLTGASVSPETSSYLKELNQAQTNARQGKSNTASTLVMDVKRKLVDSVSPIEDIFASNRRSGIEIQPSKDFSNAVDRSKRATVLATQFVKDNGLEDVVRNAPDLNALDQYLIAKHAPEVSTNTGRDTVRDQQLVAELAPVYEPFAQKVTNYSRALLDYVTEAGLISKESNAFYKKKYPNYVPLNKILSEAELNQKGFGAGPASISKQTVVQKLVGKGEDDVTQSPLSSLLIKTEDAFKQGERNKAGTILANNKDVGGFQGLITPLRTAENVTKRISLYEQAKDLKPVQNKLSRMMMTSGRKVRELKSAINALERKGLDLSLKEKAPEKTAPLTSAIETKTTPNKVIFGTGENADVVVGGKPGETTLKDKYATSTNRGKQSTKSFIDDLITLPSSDIQALKKKVATRENKLGPLFDQLQEIQDMYASVKAQRMQMFDEAALLRDAESRGKSTFSIFRDGIKEIYETTPEIAAAAKSLDATQLGVVGEVLAAPVRIARIGITGINAPFVLANVAKDQVTAVINSSKALQTSILNAPNFVKALWAALGHGKEYDNWIRSGGGGTSFDITRNAPELSLNRMRAQRNIGSKTLYTVTHPKQMLRAVEDVLARGEELTRIQQFTGTRDALLKEGMSLADANAAAAKQSRTASVNFARSGDWGRTLNSVWLYLNAGIQGGRTLASSLRDRPAQTVTKLALIGMTPVAMTTLWNTADPERKAAYDDIQEYEKDNNLIIIPNNPVKDPETGKWNVIKVPLSQEVANLTIPLRHQLESMSGAPGTNFGEVATSLVGTFTGANLSSPNAFLSQTTPQALKPGLQWGLNKNLFTGNDIVPQYMLDQGLPPEMQVKDNTSGTARIIGGAIDQSPLKVEQAVKDVFGGVGNQLINASDTVLNKAGVIPEDQIGGQSIPEGVVARFNQAAGGQQLNNLYENKPVTNGLVSTAQASDGNALPPEIVENKGLYYVKVGKGVKSFDTPEEATLAVDKQKFKESDKNIDVIGDTVFRRSKDGNVTTMPKIDYDTLMTTQKMENAKLADDYETWQDLALTQLQNFQTQMQDPTLDELEKVELQQKIDKLITDAVKYQGYGGLKKPKKAKAFNMPKMQTAKFAKPSFKMKRGTTKKSTIKTVASKKIAPPKIKVSRFKVKKA